MKPLVSIVVPVFNAEPFLTASIKSACHQTYRNIEVIAIDDGSSDDSTSTLALLASTYPQVRWIPSQHLGVSSARNIGMNAAKGDYVAFLDADDLWHPTKIEKQVAAMAKHCDRPDWAACYSLFRIIDRHGKVLKNGPTRYSRGYLYGSHLVINHIGNGSNLMVRRDAALAVGGFDTAKSHCEDRDFHLRLLKHFRIDVVPEFLTGYRRHSDCATLHHSEMAGSLILVIGTSANGPGIPPGLRRAALAAAHNYAWLKFLKDGAIKECLASLSSFLRSDPRGAAQEILYRLKNRFKAVRHRFGTKVLDPKRESAPDFFDLDPCDGVLAEETVKNTRKFERLQDFDAQLERLFAHEIGKPAQASRGDTDQKYALKGRN